MNAVWTASDRQVDASEETKTLVLEMTSQRILTDVIAAEIAIKELSEKCAEAIGMFAHLRKYDRARFSALWEPSKENLFEFQKKILRFVESYKRSIIAVTDEKTGNDYVTEFVDAFSSAEIRNESDFDTERPLRFAKFANLIQTWENHPKWDVSPSGAIGRAVAREVSHVLGSEA